MGKYGSSLSTDTALKDDVIAQLGEESVIPQSSMSPACPRFSLILGMGYTSLDILRYMVVNFLFLYLIVHWLS